MKDLIVIVLAVSIMITSAAVAGPMKMSVCDKQNGVRVIVISIHDKVSLLDQVSLLWTDLDARESTSNKLPVDVGADVFGASGAFLFRERGVTYVTTYIYYIASATLIVSHSMRDRGTITTSFNCTEWK